MKVWASKLPEVLVVEPRVFTDDRGYFFENYNKKDFVTAGIDAEFVQDNESCSEYGVLRGLHYQTMPYTQAKLLRVISGKILDVVVDIRQGSPNFGSHVAVELSEANKRQLFVPRGFAHGFVVLSERAVVNYKCDNYYAPSHERGIRFNDENLNINWRVPLGKIILSAKDKLLPLLADADLFEFTEILN